MNTFARIALLSLALATAGVVSEASAQNTLAQWLSHMPMNGGAQRLDSNGDGRVNVIGYDVSRDGRLDAVRLDTNFDGYFETVAFFDNRRGTLASMYVDTNRSGFFDTLVTDYYRDGRYFVGYDRRGTGQFSGWVPLPSNTEMPIEALYPSSMTIGGKNAGFRVTGVPEIDRLLIRQQERAICAVAECVYRVP